MSDSFTKEDRNLLIRLDERSRHVEGRIRHVDEKLSRMADELEERYVTKERHSPVEWLIYGMVATVLAAFLANLLGFWSLPAP